MDLVPTRERVGGRKMLRSHPFHSVTREVCQHGGAEPPVRRSRRGRIPLIFCHIARVQPSPEHGLLQRDMGQPPVMADLVNTRVDVAVSHPWRGCRMRPHTVAWPTRVRRRAAGMKPIRVGVGPRVGDGFARTPVEGLPGPVTPRRHPARACAPVARGHRDAAQRAWTPAVMVSVSHGVRVLLRRVPQDVIHPRRAGAPVGRHARDGHGTAAPRAGAQGWPGTDRAPRALRLGLHETALHPTPGPMGSPPVDLVPGPPGTQARARRCDGSPLHARLCWPRPHRCACAQTTRTSARVRVRMMSRVRRSLRRAIPRGSMTEPPALAPLSHTGSPCGGPRGPLSRPRPAGRDTGGPTFRVRTRAGEVSPLRRWRRRCAGCVRRTPTWPRACWPQPLRTVGWSWVTTCLRDSPRLPFPHDPRARPPWCEPSSLVLAIELPSARDEAPWSQALMTLEGY
jgi:hypothetical protein